MSVTYERNEARRHRPLGGAPIQVLDVNYSITIDDERVRGGMLDHALRNRSKQCTLGPVTVRVISSTEVVAPAEPLSLAGLP